MLLTFPLENQKLRRKNPDGGEKFAVPLLFVAHSADNGANPHGNTRYLSCRKQTGAFNRLTRRRFQPAAAFSVRSRAVYFSHLTLFTL